MKQRLAQITLVVRDYDEAIKFYTEQLNFSLAQDIRLNETKRWVIVTPPGSTETGLLLALADSKNVSEIKREDVFLYFYIPMIFGGIIRL